MNHPECLKCDCTFSSGCKREAQPQQSKRSRSSAEAYTSRSVRVPGPGREIARQLRNDRIDRGERWYRTKQKA